jgi:diguanylate cyclase (GGDEF)-like protein
MEEEFYLIKEAQIGPRQILLAKVMVTLLLACAVIVTPFATTQLQPVPGYMSAFGFGFAMIVVNIILAALLYAKGVIESKERTIRLGTAYFFVTILLIPLIATFSGGLMIKPVIGTTSSAIWLWSYGHIGFALLIIRYTLSSEENSGNARNVRRSIVAMLMLVLALTWSATRGQPYLPQILRDGKNFFDHSTMAIPVIVLGINLLALLCVIRMREKRPERLWVMIGMLASCIDIWLTVCGGARFSVGWYCAKMISLFSSLVVLISQLYGITWLYHSIADANKVLMTQANQDGLTGLSNRRCFDRLLEIEWNRARRDKSSVALLMIDVDFFKKYNDCYGHLAGDDCLRLIAEHLLRVIKRPGDVAARYGGEEFVVVLPNTDIDGARLVGERLLSNLRATAIAHEQNLPSGHVTLSIGIAAMIPAVGSNTSALALAADNALYQAKESGRNRICTAVTSSNATVSTGPGLLQSAAG